MFFFWYKPEERRNIERELKRIGRPDLITQLYADAYRPDYTSRKRPDTAKGAQRKEPKGTQRNDQKGKPVAGKYSKDGNWSRRRGR